MANKKERGGGEAFDSNVAIGSHNAECVPSLFNMRACECCRHFRVVDND